MRWLLLAWLVLGVVGSETGLTLAQNVPGKKYAFLVGINAYEHPKLPTLRFAVNDAVGLTSVLRGAGFEVVTLSDQGGPALKPTRANIQQQLQALLRRCTKNDTLLLGFAGHGLQFGGEQDAFFCPSDAVPFSTQKQTLLSLNQVYQQLAESKAGIKLLLVDACRDDPDAARGTRGVGGGTGPSVPAGVAALFSCKVGQRAYEHEEIRHGIFFHAVRQGLTGAAARDGQVNWDDLVAHVRRTVPVTLKRLLPNAEAEQTPTLTATELDAVPVLMDLSGLGRLNPLTAIWLENQLKFLSKDLERALTLYREKTISKESVEKKLAEIQHFCTTHPVLNSWLPASIRRDLEAADGKAVLTERGQLYIQALQGWKRQLQTVRQP